MTLITITKTYAHVREKEFRPYVHDVTMWYIFVDYWSVFVYLYIVFSWYACVPWAFLLPTASSLVKSCHGTYAWTQESNWDYMAWLQESWQYECLWQQKVLLFISMQLQLGKDKEERTIIFFFFLCRHKETKFPQWDIESLHALVTYFPL